MRQTRHCTASKQRTPQVSPSSEVQNTEHHNFHRRQNLETQNTTTFTAVRTSKHRTPQLSPPSELQNTSQNSFPSKFKFRSRVLHICVRWATGQNLTARRNNHEGTPKQIMIFWSISKSCLLIRRSVAAFSSPQT